LPAGARAAFRLIFAKQDPTMHKRSFLMGACGAALSTAATTATSATETLATSPRAARRGLPALGAAPDRAAWSRYLQEPFVLNAEGRSVAVVLDRLEDGPAGTGAAQFVLGFSAAAALPTGLYELAHASGQTVAVGLTAHAAAGRSATRLRAEFNLLHGA
jgi:hypothetical protein